MLTLTITDAIIKDSSQTTRNKENNMDIKMNDLYASFNASERFGLQFGMFPYDKCKGLTREESINLMGLAKQNNYK